MAITAKLYVNAYKTAFNGEINLATDTIKCALLNGYTPNQSAHDYFNDVSASEISGTGYTAGGLTLTSKTATVSCLRFTFDAADALWTSSTIDATHLVIYKSTGAAATSPLICYTDLDGHKISSANNWQATFSGSGVFYIDAL